MERLSFSVGCPYKLVIRVGQEEPDLDLHLLHALVQLTYKSSCYHLPALPSGFLVCLFYIVSLLLVAEAIRIYIKPIGQ